MTIDEISQFAKKQTEPDGLNVAATILYCRLKDIYADFKTEKIDRKQGEERKAKAVAEYEQNLAEAEQHRSYILHTAEMWRAIESAAIRYAKSGNRTPEADALMEAIYGVKMKD